MSTETIIVLCTHPAGQAAQSLASHLVEQRLAACVNILPEIKSVYSWQGTITTDTECQLIIKTRSDLFDAIKEAIIQQHPYELPEVIAVPVTRGHAPYLQWIIDSTQ